MCHVIDLDLSRLSQIPWIVCVQMLGFELRTQKNLDAFDCVMCTFFLGGMRGGVHALTT